MAVSSSQLVLDLKVQRTVIEIAILNHGLEPVRVWDRNNSWGWGTLAFDVAASSRPEEVYALTSKPRIWTKNAPEFVEIPVGRCHLVIVPAGNPEWEGLERISHLRGEAIRIRANLRIPPSPEADIYNVFVGEVSSPWQDSEPPHLWLFTNA